MTLIALPVRIDANFEFIVDRYGNDVCEVHDALPSCATLESALASAQALFDAIDRKDFANLPELEDSASRQNVAEYLVRVINSHADLLAACKAGQEAEAHFRTCEDCDQDDGEICENGMMLFELAESLRVAAILKAETP